MEVLATQKKEVKAPIPHLFTQYSRLKTAEDKANARAKQKELQTKKAKPKKQPWRETTNNNNLFEEDIKRLKGSALSNV
jgi:hypothetical protein